MEIPPMENKAEQYVSSIIYKLHWQVPQQTTFFKCTELNLFSFNTFCIGWYTAQAVSARLSESKIIYIIHTYVSLPAIALI